MSKLLMILLLLGLVAVALAIPRPDFDFDDDDDDDDDDFFRFGGLNSIRRDPFRRSFQFNSFSRSPVGFQQAFRPQQSFNSFRSFPRECRPPEKGSPDEVSGSTNISRLLHYVPVLTLVRFTPFTLVRSSADAEPSLFLYGSKYVAVLSQRCTTSEILDLAMTMISSMTNESVIFEPPMPVGTGMLLKNENNPPSKTESNKKYKYEKKNRKTIRDFNPNPNLLSKKAVETRRMKMEEFGRFRYYAKDSSFETGHERKTKHAVNNYISDSGSREKLLARNHEASHLPSSKVSRFDRKFHDIKNGSIVEKSPEDTNQILGHRQKQLIESDVDSLLERRTGVDLTTRLPWRHYWKNKSKTTNSAKNKHEKFVQKTRIKQSRSPVRKVLKGRRKISSTEFYSKTI